MTPADQAATLDHAAALLYTEAHALRMAHTMAPEYTDWREDIEAEEAHRDLTDTAAELLLIAEAMRQGAAKATRRAAEVARPASGMYVCHAVSPLLFGALETVAKHLEQTHPKSSGEQRIEMIFAAGLVHLMRTHGLTVAPVEVKHTVTKSLE